MDLFEQLAKETESLNSEEMSGMMANVIKYAHAHLNVVKAWGRFPHRNKILGREDTPEEKEAMEAGKIPSF